MRHYESGIGGSRPRAVFQPPTALSHFEEKTTEAVCRLRALFANVDLYLQTCLAVDGHVCLI